MLRMGMKTNYLFLLKDVYFIYLFGCTRSQLQHEGSFLVGSCKLFVEACKIQFPDQVSNLGPLHWEHGVLATGPPGKSQDQIYISYKSCCIMSQIKFFFFMTEYTTLQRRQWQPTPELLPGKSHGRRSLVGCSPWGQESDTTEQLHFHFLLSCVGEGNGNPLQCSCLENPRDGGAWWAAISGVTQSWTRPK